jgi:hypothetical protein
MMKKLNKLLNHLNYLKFKQARLILLFISIFLINSLFSINVNYNYSLNNVIEKGKNLTISYLNISFDQNFTGKLNIFLDSNKVYEKDINNKKEVYLSHLSFKIDQIYEKLIFKILDNDSKLVSQKEEKLYIYYFLNKLCEVKDDKIIKKDEDLKVKIKFKNEDELDKEVYLYLDGSEEKDYSYDDKLDKETKLNVDDLVKEFKCKVLITEDDINKEIYNFSQKILVYDIDPLSFDFDDEETLEVNTEDFDLSNEENKVVIKLSLEDHDYVFEFENKTSIDDFDFNIFDNDEIKDDEDKIKLIKDLLEDLSSNEGVEISYKVKLYLYNNGSLVDDKEVLDENYYLKNYEDEGSIEFDESGNDFSLEILEFPQEAQIMDKLNAKVLAKLKDGKDFNLKVCMAFNGESYCKSVYLEEDEEEKKEVEFSIDIPKDIKPGDYKVYFYAYDEDNDKILWKSKDIKIKAKKAVKIIVDNQVLIGKEGETKNLELNVENLYDDTLTTTLTVECGDQFIKKSITLKKGEIKRLNIPLKIEENCNGKVYSNVKMVDSENEFSIIVHKNKEITKEENKSNKIEEENKEKNIEMFYCKVNKDLIYSDKDLDYLTIQAPLHTKVNISFDREKLIVNPYSFEIKDKNEKQIKIIRNSDDKIVDIIKITCKKDNKEIEKDVIVYFKEKSKLTKEKLIIGGIIGVSALVIIGIIIFLLI